MKARPLPYFALVVLAACGSAEPMVDDPAAEPSSVELDAPATTLTDPRTAFLPAPVRPVSESTLATPAYRDALAALDVGDAQSAALRLAAVAAGAEGDADRRKLHAYALLADGRATEAGRLLQAVTAESDPGLQWLQAEARRRLGRAPDAIAGYRRAAAAFPQSAAVLAPAARCALDAGDGTFALECLDRLVVIGAQPDDAMALRARAHGMVGDYAAALAAYDRLIAAEPESVDRLEAAGHLAFKAALAQTFDIGFDRAIGYFSKAIELVPQNSRLHYNLGCALDWDDQVDGAETAYVRALELDPGAVSTAENLAELLARTQRPTEALRVLDQVLRQPLTAEQVERVRQRRRRLETGQTKAQPSIPG